MQCKAIPGTPDDTVIYVYCADTEELSFILGTSEGRQQYELDTVPSQLVRDKNLVFFIYGDRYDYLARLKYYFPDIPVITCEDEISHAVMFYRAMISKDRVNQLFGLNSTFYSRPGATGDIVQQIQIGESDLLAVDPIEIPEKSISARMTGGLIIREALSFSFHIDPACDCRIALSGRLVYSCDGKSSPYAPVITLPEGIFPIEVVINRISSRFSLNLQWKSEDSSTLHTFSPDTFLTLTEPAEGLRTYLFRRNQDGPDLTKTFVYPYLNIQTFDPPLFYQDQRDSIVFKGKLIVPETGEYQFLFVLDVKSDISIDGSILISAVNPGQNDYTVNKYLEKGEHDFQMLFGNPPKLDFIKAYWKLPGSLPESPYQTIEATSFIPDTFIPGETQFAFDVH
jgi:hypothetical protein